MNENTTNAAQVAAFQDWPEGPRFAVRYAVDWLGGEIVGYCGTGLQVRMPAPGRNFAALCDVLKAAGLTDEQPGSAYYFPIGSENVPEERRHFGPYQRKGDAPGYTFSIHWHPVDNRNAPRVAA